MPRASLVRISLQIRPRVFGIALIKTAENQRRLVADTQIELLTVHASYNHKFRESAAVGVCLFDSPHLRGVQLAQSTDATTIKLSFPAGTTLEVVTQAASSSATTIIVFMSEPP
jgi:hypothetical protein